ncbi:unnamed protein product [Acanthoscelides obtectus]|uniref:RING-type E3 ubiquitin transferase n=1 Tax=Acanthoscelides obtectus TaxID=200917 RepID=A0A9P0LNG4_ACAOB|nr:unnamed protein product [Acanthoscelides obtectus]CAK1634952.1 Probable E3 ubiquitin-protein ligase makorin-2 [Acanthoscelides obtectus]
MNFGMNHEPVICRYNLRGMCRFGGRCRNIHDNPEKIAEKLVEKSIENNLPQQDASLGACALPPTSAPGKENINMNIYGPSTSSVEEAIQLVRISESKDKTCGICFEIILAKGTGPSKRFGILPNCNHCFCFTCIKTWRQCRDVDLEVSKACPECRIASDFVYPSKHWLDNKNEKTMFIDNQKQRMKNLDCKYYRKGKGTCPFGNKCLYRHALPNGKLIDVGPPRRLRRSEDGPTDFQQIVQLLERMQFNIERELLYPDEHSSEDVLSDYIL